MSTLSTPNSPNSLKEMQGNMTPQQQAVLLQLQQAQMRPPPAAVAPPPPHANALRGPPPPPPTTTTANGVTTTIKHLSDGDDQYRNAKRRKPTALSLPTKFTPSGVTSPGPTDLKLADSLAALDSLAKSYKSLQALESRLDWTFARKAIELTEKSRANATDEGDRVQRSLRLHIEAFVKDQEWQLVDRHQLEQAAEVPRSERDEVKVPRIELRLSGKILEDESQAKVPFTRHYQRITIESPLLASPLSWNRSNNASFPSSLTFTIPHSVPAPESTSPLVPLSLKITLDPFSYSHSPTSQLFTLLPPELGQILSLSECTRSEALHHLWSYVRLHNLIVENIDGRGTGGITTTNSPGGGSGLNKKYFGGIEKVAWHHLGEWVNRWLGPTVPRTINYSFTPSPASTSNHQAFDLPVSTFPFSPATSSTSQQTRLQTASILASLSSTSSTSSSATIAQPPPSSNSTNNGNGNGGIQSALESLNSQISTSSLAVSSHLLQLESLLSYTRNPTAFLSTYLSSQSSSLDRALSVNPRGDDGSMMGLGEGWKESLRGSKYFTGEGEGGGGEWVREAVGVWLAREREGELRKHLAAANANGSGGGGGGGGVQQQQQYAGRR